jgi:class 3 adenylate cyclase
MHTNPAHSSLGRPLIFREPQPVLPETAWATFLFIDLRGYGALAEHLAPVELLPLLAEYFVVLTDAVLKFGGQIFHVAEARLMAGFGVGDSRCTHNDEALAAARTILQEFSPLKVSWQSQFSIDTGVGVGIHRGEAAVGVFGPPGQQSPTLVGGCVHVAAQLCSRARVGEILISDVVKPVGHDDSTAARSSPSMRFVHLPDLELRDCHTPMDIWCLPAASRPQMRRATHSLRRSG